MNIEARHTWEVRDNRCVYTLAGDFRSNDARDLHQEVVAQNGKPKQVVVDMRQLTGCETEARDVFVAIHKLWSKRADRIVYLATEPRFRGLSLWIMHMAGDDRAKAVGSEAQLETWMRGSSGRQEEAFRTLGARNVPIGLKRRERLGMAGRAAAMAMGWMMYLALGTRPPWVEEIIRTHGIAGLKRFNNAVTGALDELTEHFGERDAQALLAINALWNGCSYCSYGHLLVMNLLYFEKTGRLSPVPETRLLEWQKSDDRDIMDELEQRLVGEEFAILCSALRLSFNLRMGGAESLGDSFEREPVVRILRRYQAAWTLVNECTIVDESLVIPPLHPRLSRDHDLLRAYRQARMLEETS